MPNPFDAFDAQVSNPFDAFDTDIVHQIPGLEYSVDSSSQVGNDDSSILDKIRGVIEAGATTATGIPALVAGGIGGLGNDKRAGEISNALTYQPRTEKGQEYSKEIGEFANRYLNPLLGGLGEIRVPEQIKAVKNDDVVINRVLEKQKELDQQKASAGQANPFDQFDTQPNPAAFQEMVDQLRSGEQEPVSFTNSNNGMDTVAQGLEQRKAIEAQRTLDDRQAEMEQTVAKQGGLDYNAAERVRQEEASVPPQRDPMLDDPSVSPEHREWYQALLDESRKDEPKSGTPAFFKEPDKPYPNVPNNQRGAINPEVFQEGFQKLKQLADGVWLIAYNDRNGFNIEATKDSRVIGNTTFDKTPVGLEPVKQNLEAFSTSSKYPGMATEMYRFASELGNDIVPSKTQTQAGKAMWERFEQKGLSQNGTITRADGTIRSPGSKQQGALFLGKQKQLEKVLGKDNMMAEKPDVDAYLEAAKGGKDSNAWNNTESGPTLAAMKRRAPAIQALARTSQYAQKVGDLNIRKNVLPVEKAFRTLSRDDLESLSGLLKEEMLRKERFDPEAIMELPAKMQAAYAHIREMLDDTWKIQNEQRVSEGLKPITRMEAYASSAWQGDFRRPLFEKTTDGRKLAWYLAADSKLGIESQTKSLLKKFPDLIVDPKEDHIVKNYRRQTDIQSAYPTIIDILGRDDPAVQAIKEYVENQTVNEAATFLGQHKHFEPKAGIRGFVGDRPGKEGFGESLKFIEQQIAYAKNAYQWSAIQSVSGDLKKIINDPELNQTQPNNMRYARDYVKNLLGRGEHVAVTALADSFKQGLGFSPAMINRGIANMKSFFIVQKLAGLGQTVSNLIQPANMAAHLVSNEFGNLGKAAVNLPKAYAVGISGGMAMALNHFHVFLNDIKSGVSPDQLGFYGRAFRYAEDNGITARSILDESPISSSFSPVSQTAKVLGRTISTPEAFARSIAFMTATQFLKDSGKYKTDMEVFQKAEDLTNAGMVDYRQVERPLIFSKMGGAGNFLNTLQNYPMNWYNQFNLFAREALRKNPAPFFAFLATQYALAGAMGLPGFSDVDKLYQFMKTNVISKFPTIYGKVQESDFWTDPKMWMVKNFGESSVYGALSAKSGLGLTTRLNTPGLTDMIQAPGGPGVDIAKQAWNAGKAITNPTRDNIAQSAMASAPLGVQGLVENLPQFEGSTFEKTQDGNKLAMSPGNISAHKAVYKRDDNDTTARLFGFRTQKEAVGREIGYRLSQDNSTSQEVERSIPGKFYAALRTGDKSSATDLYNAYVKLTGQPISSAQFEKQIEENYIPTIDRATTAAKTIDAVKGVARARAMFDQIQKEHQ